MVCLPSKKFFIFLFFSMPRVYNPTAAFLLRRSSGGGCDRLRACELGIAPAAALVACG